MKTLVKIMLALAAIAPCLVSAQDYPARPVTVVIPFSPGGSNDVIGRYLADALGKLWKQPVVVENKAGGGSVIGTIHVATSPPDGYRVLLVSGSYTTTAATRTDQFDPKALKPVGVVATGHNAVVTGLRVPMASLADLARESKKTTLFFATSGVGSAQHFNGELLKEVMGIEMTAVPYRGGNEGLQDLIAGRIDVVVGSLAGLLPHIESGKAKPVAVLSKTRSRALPNVPTAEEAGYPGAVVENYWAVLVPAATPEPIVRKIHQGIKIVTTTTEGRQFLGKLDAEPSEMNPQEVADYMKKEIDYWTKIAKKLNISVK